MTWMQTVEGKAFSLVNPCPGDVDFREIAHALSHLCRFAGHTRKFYSVAEHSCRVADLLPRPIKLYGLLHDAHEAYIGDWTTPVKSTLFQADPGAGTREIFHSVEQPLQKAILDAANLDPIPHPAILAAVKYADLLACVPERRDLLGKPAKPWDDYEKIKPLLDPIHPWSIERARHEFLRRLNKWRAR